MKRVLILGAGFGGISTAHHLRGLLGDGDEVVLVDRGTEFMMGFHKNAIVAGREKPGTGVRPLASLPEYRQGTVESIDVGARSAVVDGETIQADALVVALGAELAPQAIPGLDEHGLNYYTRAGAEKAAEAFAGMQQGRIVIGVFGAPYKCPPAPFELSLLIADALKDRGALMVKTTVFTPLPMSIPALGPQGCNPLESRLALEGIDFRANTKAERVEAGRVILEGGAAPLPFDLLIAVPPHRCPKIAVDAGLAPNGWIKVNPRTLETEHAGVWALGDATAIPLTNGQALPKAGLLADKEGRVVARRVAALLRGEDSDAQFTGEGGCHLEVGGGEAMLVKGRFFEDPPQVELSPPSAEQLADKEAVEAELLGAWFGA